MAKENNNLMEKIVSLAKRRGFVYPGSEIYGGLGGTWDYGPLGAELKNNIKRLWWKKFVHERDDMVGLDAAIIMNPQVWRTSGHVENFTDPLVECKKCHHRMRADQIDLKILKSRTPQNREMEFSADFDAMEKAKCENCGAVGQFTAPAFFNLLFETFIGPKRDSASTAYLRPETAQAMFVNFKNVLDTTRRTLPFGIAQVGKAFRNEITPGNFIFRTREFEQMEIEYFVHDKDWKESFEYWRKAMWSWMTDDLGLDKKHIHELEVPEGERAHYSKRTIDFEYDYPFGRKELYGLAYRGDFDLKNHFKEPPYKEEGTEAFYPHVIEPTWGVDRSVLAALLDAYDASDKDRVVLHLKPHIAPYKAAVFPLLANKPALVKKAREIYLSLVADPMSLDPIAWDDRGNIGKRYYSQDEIGTPFCITVDFDTLEKDDVTVRDRDTAKQERISIDKLPKFLHDKIYAL